MFRGSSQDVALRDDLISNLLDHSLHSLGHVLLCQETEGVKTRHSRDRVEKRRTDDIAKDRMKQ